MCTPQDNLQDLTALTLAACEQMKASSTCQDVYDSIEKEGFDSSDFALNCQVDQSLSAGELHKFRFSACAFGGLRSVVSLLRLPAVAGQALGEATAKAVLSLQADAQRQADCDKNPEKKSFVYRSYNMHVPSLLQIPVPNQRALDSKSCAQIETDFYHAKSQTERQVSRQTDYKLFQKNPSITLIEKEYLDWKRNEMDFAAGENASLIRVADEALQKYGIKIQCYNMFRRIALRCEVYANLAMLGGAGAKGIAFLAGMKASRAEALAAQAARTESVEIVHWLNTSHFDILINGKLYNISSTGSQGVKPLKPGAFERAASSGIPSTRFKVAVTPEELAKINNGAQELAQMKWGPTLSLERQGQIFTKLKNGQGFTCSGTVCALVDNATKASSGRFHVPQVLRASPTIAAAYIRGMSILGNSRIISIETTGTINLAQYARNQEVMTGTAITTAYVIIKYLDAKNNEKRLAVPIEDYDLD